MSKTILLADDSVTIQKVVELTFMDGDYKVIAVSDGISAVGKLQESRPDLVIADIHMPGTNGYDVCRQVKAAMPEVPVLLLVGTFEPFDEEQAIAVGSDGHLKKPFDSQVLLARVEELIQRKAIGTLPSVAAFEPAETMEPPSLEPPPFVEPSTEVDLAAGFTGTQPTSFAEINAEPAVDEEPETGPAPAAPEFPEARFSAEPTEEIDPLEEANREEPTQEAVLVAPVADAEPVPAEPVPAEPVPAEPVPAEPVPAEPASGEPVVAATSVNGSGSLSDGDIERIAQRVVELAGEKMLREVAWEVVPDLAEVIIRERIRELESQVE